MIRGATKHSHRRSHHRRGGFTLVEMLVVVGIIVILAAILVPAVYMGLSAASDAAIAVEVANLDAAMRQYKNITHGYAHPPNFTSDAVVRAHIKQKFGRVNWASARVPPTGLDPAEALVFWLQGFGSDPTNPLIGKRQGLFDFDEARLVETRVDGTAPNEIQLYHYFPKGAQRVPYVYIHHDSYTAASYTATSPQPGTGTIRAYRGDADGDGDGQLDFVNKDTYQIISAGQDGDWGTDTGSANKQYPSGTNFSPGDQDNIANFSEGTLAD